MQYLSLCEFASVPCPWLRSPTGITVDVVLVMLALEARSLFPDLLTNPGENWRTQQIETNSVVPVNLFPISGWHSWERIAS